MKMWIKRLILLTVLAALTGAGGLAWYATQPLRIEALPKILNVTPGTNLRSLSTMLKREGVIGNAQ
ncbi:MAG: aminodeoxychorismate lyase, partial [Thiobacillus sp.]|nr:aminodeoxychorismate lyase [Thiobacillus sp.]